MRALRRLLKLVLALAGACVAVLLVVTALMAVGVIKPATPKPAFPSVVVQPSASIVAVTKPLPERRCVLRTDGVQHVAIFPDAASAQAFHEVVSAADGLRMLDAPGVFEVIVGTRCTVLDLGAVVSRVRISEGEHADAEGFVATEWAKEK